MSRPGVEVTSSASAPAQGVPTDTSVYFCVGEASQGPIDQPTRLTSLDAFVSTYGDRIPGTYGYDSIDAYFHEGGATAYFMRLSDSAAAASTGDASAIAAGATVTATSPGVWGDALELDVAATPGGTVTQSKAKGKSNGNGNGNGAPKPSPLLSYPEAQASGAFMASVKQGGKLVAVSKPLDTLGEVRAWALSTGLITVTGGADTTAVAAGTVPLAGGNDGTVPVADADALVAALTCMPKELGPGQVNAPGRGDYDSQAAILAHCAATNRVAFLDGLATDGPVELTSAAGYLRGALEDRYGALWGPWAVIPGLAPGTTRVVPWSPVQAALCARNDLAGNPNQAAAGAWGETQYVTDLVQTFSEPDMEALLYAGVNTARRVYGAIQAYAFRTLADPEGMRAGWLELNWARLNMAIVADSEAVAQDYVFSQLDGRMHTIAAFGGALTGVLVDYYNVDALFGDDVTEAFSVNVGPQVNTVEKLSDGILSAVMQVRMSPHAELVRIDIVKVPITVSLT